MVPAHEGDGVLEGDIEVERHHVGGGPANSARLHLTRVAALGHDLGHDVPVGDRPGQAAVAQAQRRRCRRCGWPGSGRHRPRCPWSGGHRRPRT